MIPIKTYILLLLGCLLFVQCDFESDTPLLDELDQDYKQYDYYIDKYGNEGIVIYVHPTKAYVVVMSADEAYLPWGPIDNAVIKGDTISKYGIDRWQFGLAMLQYMQADGLDKYPAQMWCYSKNKGEEFAYSGSWRLPSFFEYNHYIALYQLKRLNEVLASIGGTEIDADKVYWTATEDYNNYIKLKDTVSDYDKNSRAVAMTPSKTLFTDKDKWLKKNHYYVRAIKYIYFGVY